MLAIREHGDYAVALFDTHPIGEPYLYEVHYQRERGSWVEGNSGNGPGWASIDPDSEIGVVTLWDEAPPDTDRVRAEFHGESFEEPIEQGIYMFVWWDVPCSTAHATAFRTKGAWVRAP